MEKCVGISNEIDSMGCVYLSSFTKLSHIKLHWACISSPVFYDFCFKHACAFIMCIHSLIWKSNGRPWCVCCELGRLSTKTHYISLFAEAAAVALCLDLDLIPAAACSFKAWQCAGLYKLLIMLAVRRKHELPWAVLHCWCKPHTWVLCYREILGQKRQASFAQGLLVPTPVVGTVCVRGGCDLVRVVRIECCGWGL